jgi:hypothetical protein
MSHAVSAAQRRQPYGAHDGCRVRPLLAFAAGTFVCFVVE